MKEYKITEEAINRLFGFLKTNVNFGVGKEIELFFSQELKEIEITDKKIIGLKEAQ